MPEQTGPGQERRYLPPVFTQWTGSANVAASGARAAPPFVPEDGALPGPAAGNGFDADAGPLPAGDATLELVPGLGPATDAFPSPAGTGPIPAGDDGLPAFDAQRATPRAAAGDAAPGTPGVAGVAGTGQVTELAERLERMAARLRSDGAAALGPGLSGNDRLDAALTGLLAGYLAGRDG